MPHALQTIVCGTCLSEPPAFDTTIAACDYAAPADHLVQNLKFHAQLALASAFSQRISHAWRQQQHDSAVTQLPALMTAVPLSGARLAARGFNQALEIAKPLARDLGISLVPQLCLRTRDTQAQAALSMAQRQVNMRGAFVVAPEVKASVQQRHVFVVDDVITTGHTLNALATCLKRWGAARVTNLVFARTPTHGN
jgi:ComF family protein